MQMTIIETAVTATNTSSFAHRTGSRLGTAARVDRIIPVLYSPVTNRTPRAPMSSWPR
jgi:hypothetical protein